MKINLEVKNPGKALRPSKNDIILYDGKQWYVTTKEELFREFYNRLEAKEKQVDHKLRECDDKIVEMNEQRRKNAEQIIQFGEIIEGLISKEDK